MGRLHGLLYNYLRKHRLNGWCIQGFITGTTLVAAILLVALGVPAGVFLDVTAPGLLIAMAVGRVGCFYAGCCGGLLSLTLFLREKRVTRVGTTFMASNSIY